MPIPDKELLKLRVKAGKEYDVDLNEMLVLDENNLKSAYQDQGSLFAWWKAARAIARRYRSQLNKKLNERRSALTKDLRSESDEKLLKWTLSDIEARILLDDQYKLLGDKLIDADYHQDLLDAVIGALDHRKEMLISLGAQVRQEINQNLK